MHRGSHRAPSKGRSKYLVVLLVVGMFVALAIPAAAGNHAMATGDVYWTNASGRIAGIHTTLSLHEDAPGSVSEFDDRGWVYQYVPPTDTSPAKEALIRVDCVLIEGSEAHWGGWVVAASGGYTVGGSMVGWLDDQATPGANGDGIGSYYDHFSNPCSSEALAWTGGGTVTGGNLKVHPITTP
jgi:hypothetical protein